MTQPLEAPQQPPEHFMTPRFFGAVVAAGGMALSTNMEELADLSEFVRERFGFGLPAQPGHIDFAYYWTAKGQGENEHYYKAPGHFPFIPGSQLGQRRALAVHKRTIEARRRTVFELQTQDLSAPLSLAVARAIVAQPPEMTGLIAGADAWADFGRRKLRPSGLLDSLINVVASSQTSDQRLAREAAQRFPRALVLERTAISR